MTAQRTSGKDPLTAAQRHHCMQQIRGRNTKPELLIRRGLHARGWRYRLHRRDLPGRPDLALAGRRAVVFVHGCFWHGHDCPLFRWPASNEAFWREKIAANQSRDRLAEEALKSENWRLCVVWECALKGPGRWPPESVIDAISAWLGGDEPALTVRSRDLL